ncbi:probable inactive poly [ADP-ribose] polymerase SRO2 [Rhododendron vialii]|uniref:probable inactive poly [ADP-ribose] polymerase SRO2 n=1 Tax=Rhododendron vialii TaxID=182163 RepID=UPI0026601079|nr:probable inactive poly [ADP-ribose] polymerase SRO2 [Rhododendron vialii]
MEMRDGMRREKSTVGVGDSGDKIFRSPVYICIPGCSPSTRSILPTPSVSLFALENSCNSICLPLCSREFGRNISRVEKMEHFGELEEQVSISIDENEIPIPDSEDDSFSSSVFEEFGIFKGNGLTRVEERNTCYKVINGCVAQGMGKDKNVAAVHKIPWLGPNGRLEAFRISLAEMVKKCGGNGNIKHAWYGGSRDEICGIISHGFRRCRQSDHGEDGFGVHLYPLDFVMDGLLTSAEDEYGLRHLLLCNVILGKTEVVRPSSKQFKPSSNKFDSGVDDLSKPTRMVIWEAYMNSRIFPSYVVSFRAHVLGFGRDQTPVYKPTTQCVEFSVLIPKLANVLPPSKMALICQYQSEFRRKKISRAQLIHRLRQLAGDELLNDVIKTRESDGTGAA